MPEPKIWQVLFVDDDSEFCESAKELEGEPVNDDGEQLHIETMTDFDDTLAALEKQRFDIIILDVRLTTGRVRQEDKGRDILESIKQKRFIPVIFYTAVPHLVQDLENQEKPLIRVVEKTETLSQVLKVIREILATGIPAINRALIRHLEVVQRDYMWGSVARHWEQYSDQSDYRALAYLLASRLAVSLSGPGIQQLAQDLGDPVGAAIVAGNVHPMQYYLLPPVDPSPLAGDLYQGKIGEQCGYWILLTPSCDMAHNKVEKALFALCEPLEEFDEYQHWSGSLPEPSNKEKKELEGLLTDNRRVSGGQPERYQYLPGALLVPDLVVDFQHLVALPRRELDTLERFASLDSPFAEALVCRFTRYFGRLGTPDLDTDYVLSQLSSKVTKIKVSEGSR